MFEMGISSARCKTIRRHARNSVIGVCVPFLGLLGSTAYADTVTPLNDMFSFSGFGTLGMTHSTNGSADYVSNAFEPNGAGHTRRYAFQNDTVLGAQLTAKFTNKLTAVVQLVSQHEYDNAFKPHVEWANIKYALTSNFSVRVGRIEIPTFANSDYRDVGYANPWLRVPVEVYNSEPITSSDGADASYSFAIGSAIDTVRLLYGTATFHAVPGPFRVHTNNIFGAYDTLEIGALTARFGFTRGNVTLSAFPVSLGDLPSTSYSLSAVYDPGRWFVQSEVARVTADMTTPGYISGYITGGVRVGKWTPYLTYARSYSMQRPTLTENMDQGQQDASVGVRWDFARNLDLKAQFDHTWLPNHSTGNLTNIQPSYRLGSGTNVLSLAIDFVF